MELKHQEAVSVAPLFAVLIVPYGIETPLF